MYLQWLCVPFLLLNPSATTIVQTAFNHTFQEPWVGSLDRDDIWMWIDDFLMLVSLVCFPGSTHELKAQLHVVAQTPHHQCLYMHALK